MPHEYDRDVSIANAMFNYAVQPKIHHLNHRAMAAPLITTIDTYE